MPTLVFELPEGSPDPCPNACGGLTEDPYGGPCKACWAKTDFRACVYCGDRTCASECEESGYSE